MYDFSGKCVLVTGASRGIGRAIALGFAQAGAAVSICARKQPALDRTHAELTALGRSHAARCDLANADSIAKYVQEAAGALGGIDILINNASAFGRSDTEENWQDGFAVDLMSVVRTTRAALPWLQKAQSGAIINIGSIAATRPSRDAPAYGTFKAAIRYYTASQAAALAKLGVRVNSVAPGAVTAPGHFWEQRRADNDPAYIAACKAIPAGRLGETAEIADVVMFMASPAARWVYGQTLVVDGGQTLFGG